MDNGTPPSISSPAASMIDSEEILVQRAQKGDPAAFEELVRRTSRLLFARLYLETGDAHQAEDLLQDTFLTAYRTLRQLSRPDRFRSWLMRIAQNAAIDAARHEHRKKRTPDPEAIRWRQAGGEVPRPEEVIEKEELRQKVLALLRDMPEEYRLPLTLRYLVGDDYESIQLQMGLSNGTLRGLLHRGMQRLRMEMKKALGDAYPAPSAE